MEPGVMRKGQASIEFILILLLAVLYLSTVVIPYSETAQATAEDVSAIAKLVASQERLVNALRYSSLSAEGSRQTLEVLVPENGSLECGSRSITANYMPKSAVESGNCTGTPLKCTKTIDVGTAFQCSAPAQPGIYIVTVERDAARPVVSFEQIA